MIRLKISISKIQVEHVKDRSYEKINDEGKYGYVEFEEDKEVERPVYSQSREFEINEVGDANTVIRKVIDAFNATRPEGK